MGGHHYLEDSELSNLPEEAFDPFYGEGPFEPNEQWLSKASKDDIRIVLREWFCDRYCDPALETPYNGREGGYLFIHGGPYDPAIELPKRFSGLVDDELIEEAVSDLHNEVGDAWAPIRRTPDYDYDEWLDISVRSSGEPLRNLQRRLSDLSMLTRAPVPNQYPPYVDEPALLRNLIYGALISAFESFLWETASYWVKNDDQVLRNIVTRVPQFAETSIQLKDIFEVLGGLRDRVSGVMQRMVWHDFDKVAPMLTKGLDLKLRSLKFLKEAIQVRHDIAHRSGVRVDGQVVVITSDDTAGLAASILAFSTDINNQLSNRVPSSLVGLPTGSPPPMAG